jgi:hypothetical protein
MFKRMIINDSHCGHRSFEEHAEHFVLLNPEVFVTNGAREIFAALHAVRDLVAFSVVGGREVCVGTVGGVAVVGDCQIVPRSEFRTPVRVALDQLLPVLGDVLLALVEGEKEGLLALVVHKGAVGCVPLIVAESPDDTAELSLDQDEGVLEVIAFLVECGRLEPIFRCPEDPLELYRLPETLPQQFQVLTLVIVTLFDDE